MKKENGFVLISVLIITTITTLLSFSQISNNRLQERIGGNQQKELNARLAAEKGLFSAFEYIDTRNKAGISNATIKTELHDGEADGASYAYQDITLNTAGTTFTLTSKGEVNGAIAYLKTQIEAIERSGAFDNAVIACEGVTVWGSSDIDSFADGSYSDSTKDNHGDVRVITATAASEIASGLASVNLGGSGTISGNVTTPGTISDSSHVIGTSVEGYTGGGDDECDPLSIVTGVDGDGNVTIGEMTKISDQVTTSVNSFSAVRRSTANFDGNAVTNDGEYTPQLLTVLGEIKDVYVFDDFNSVDQNNVIQITGNTTFYIQGDMTIKNTIFELVGNDSSLTVFIEGNISIETGSEIFSGEFVTNSGNVPLTVYSSNSDSTPSSLNGNGQIYMNLYAPLETVSYTGGGAILGALRGKNVDISGNGDIHYDEGLAEAGSGNVVPASYASVYYHYVN